MDTKEKRQTAPPAKRSTAGPGSAARPGASGKAPVKSGRGASAQKSAAGSSRTQTKANAPAGRTAGKRRQRPAPKQPTPDVVYTQPGPFNRNRFLLRLATVVAAVLALIFGISIFFKVETVTVSGNEKYTPWEVREASGIKDGDNLLGLNGARITSNIISGLPYVDKVRIGIKLPDTVKIEIVELDVVYAIQADDGSWWLMRADGVIVEKTNDADAELHTKVLGVQITGPETGKKAVAAQPVAQETTADGQQIPVTVRAEEQLDTAVTILQYLEENGVIGDAASVNVGDLLALELWFGDRYQVTIGDATQLKYKIESMKSAIDQMGDYQSGTLDVSFTTWPNQVGYTPFQ